MEAILEALDGEPREVLHKALPEPEVFQRFVRAKYLPRPDSEGQSHPDSQEASEVSHSGRETRAGGRKELAATERARAEGIASCGGEIAAGRWRATGRRDEFAGELNAPASAWKRRATG